MSEDLTGAYELLQALPRIGLGAFCLDSVELSIQRLTDFFNHGGRLLEISELFSNYQYVWPAMANAQLARKDIFILVRIWPQQQTPGALQERILKFLLISNFEYIDILMAHAPIDINNRFEQWNALENVKKAGLAKTLGLANLSLNQIMTVIKNATILPAFFATEISPFHQQADLVEYCYAGSITIINFEPCCKGIRNRFPKLMELCEPLSASPEQILFRWSLQKGFVTLIPPNSKSVGVDPAYLDIPIPADIMEMLDSWNEDQSTTWAPVVDEDG